MGHDVVRVVAEQVAVHRVRSNEKTYPLIADHYAHLRIKSTALRPGD
ncbi:hypothetical protein AB4Z50_14910 [Paenibacillus sp. 2TAB26]